MRGTVTPGVGIPMLEIGRPNGRLVFDMEITVPGWGGLCVDRLRRRPGPCVTLCDMSLRRCLGQWQRGIHLRAALPLGEALGRGE